MKPTKAEKKVVYRHFRCASAEKAAWFLTTLITTKSNPNELTVWRLYSATKILQLDKATKNTMKGPLKMSTLGTTTHRLYTTPCGVYHSYATDLPLINTAEIQWETPHSVQTNSWNTVL